MSRKTIAAGLTLALIAAIYSFPLLEAGMRRGGPRGPASAGQSASIARTEAEKKIMSVINAMDSDFGEKYLSVSYADGQCLRLLTETADAKRVVEIGTSTGYSGLWFSLALSATGGKLITHEIDAGRLKIASENFKKAGVSDIVTTIQGDAHEAIKNIKGMIDIVFLDADKEGYVDYLNKLLPQVREGGLILAHNVDSRGMQNPEYFKAVTTNPDLETIFYEQGGGLAVTLKKRTPLPESVDTFFKGIEDDVRQKEAQKRSGGPNTIPNLDVVFVPTPQDVVEKMLEVAQVKKTDIVYDLGCGDGRIVVTAAKKYGCRAWGFDIDPRRIKESIENVKKNNVENLVTIEQKDIFTLDLSKADVITMFLLPELDVKLIPQFEKCKPGTRIVSHEFDIKGIKPEKVYNLISEGDPHPVYYWITPLKKE